MAASADACAASSTPSATTDSPRRSARPSTVATIARSTALASTLVNSRSIFTDVAGI
jgi:hypothetical protein